MRTVLITVVVTATFLAGAFLYESQPDIPRAALEAKYATPPSQFATLPDGARVHYRDRGPRDGSVLVLVHGSDASLFTWEPWSKSLSATFRVISLDLPAHGLTGAVPNRDYSQRGMTVFLAEFADQLGLRRFALAGSSMGGGVAARFAEMYPRRLTHLILVDAVGMPVKPGDRIPIGLRIAHLRWMRPIVLHVTPRIVFVDGLHDAIVRTSMITNEMIDGYWDFHRMEGTREATYERFQTVDDSSYVHDHVGAISMPTLILWGDQDHLIPVEAAHKFQAAVPGSKVIIYPATGHIPMEEVADQSAADVRAFLTAPIAAAASGARQPRPR
jgi:pimeloyl-ACP methyl ester carboxylesterase